VGVRAKARPNVQVECETCGTSFSKGYYEYKKAKHHYCSKECVRLSKIKLVVLECANCGRLIAKEPCRVRGENFCDRECRRQWMVGDNNPAWKGLEKTSRDTAEYREWRLSVYERDQFTCQVCEVSGVPLNAHHIKAYSRFPELRTEVNNGVTLCESCHKRFHDHYGRVNFTSDDYYEFTGDTEWV
jgi:hypothetical protein